MNCYKCKAVCRYQFNMFEIKNNKYAICKKCSYNILKVKSKRLRGFDLKALQAMRKEYTIFQFEKPYSFFKDCKRVDLIKPRIEVMTLELQDNSNILFSDPIYRDKHIKEINRLKQLLNDLS